MKKTAIFLLALGLILAACAPTGATGGPTPDILATMVASTMQAVTPLAPPPTSISITVPTSVTMNGVAVAFNNVTLVVPIGLASGAHGEIAPASGSPDEPGGVVPQHTVITLDGYNLGPRFHQPQILVYRVDEYAAANEAAAIAIEQLRTILGDNNPNFPDKLPHLPVFYAEQLFHAKATKLDFGSGSGIRYLTQYSQAFVQINNHELLYTFQGLTSDGKYYVSVQLPITTPLLDTMSAPNFNDPAFTGDQYGVYLQGVTKTLNSLDSPIFSPTLETFDQLVMSIVIGQ